MIENPTIPVKAITLIFIASGPILEPCIDKTNGNAMIVINSPKLLNTQ